MDEGDSIGSHQVEEAIEPEAAPCVAFGVSTKDVFRLSKISITLKKSKMASGMAKRPVIKLPAATLPQWNLISLLNGWKQSAICLK